ncbi:MAG: hypothetical protein KC502_23850 [Myxococcales bacterium]|nr:hypothetical protein [Myxococcales bacterium]
MHFSESTGVPKYAGLGSITRRLGVVALIALLHGCLLPELDTPPVDPSLVPEETTGTTTKPLTCTPGSYNNNIDLRQVSATTSYAGECTVKGNVKINPANPNYKKLATIRTIQGSVAISGTSTAKAVSVLPSLVSVTAHVLIENTKLVHAPVFPNLTTIGQKLSIRGNFQLAEIHGFDALGQVTTLDVVNNSAVTWKTFGKLEDIGAGVTISGNTKLTSISLPSAQRFITTAQISENGCKSVSFANLNNANRLIFRANKQLASLSVPQMTIVSRLRFDSNSKLGDAGMKFGKVTKVDELTLRHQLHVTKVSWLGPKPVATSTVEACYSGITAADAVAWFTKMTGTKATPVTCK